MSKKPHSERRRIARQAQKMIEEKVQRGELTEQAYAIKNVLNFRRNPITGLWEGEADWENTTEPPASFIGCEEKLAERGIVLKQRIAMQPACEEVAQIFNGKDYNIKVEKEEYIPIEKELVMYMEDEQWL